MRDDDGTLAIVSTLVDHAAPANPPPSYTRARAIGNEGIASIHAISPHGLEAWRAGGEPEPAAGGNPLRDPRRYW